MKNVKKVLFLLLIIFFISNQIFAYKTIETPFKVGEYLEYEVKIFNTVVAVQKVWVKGIEVVNGVSCLKLTVSDAIIWLAQTIYGDVWFIKAVTSDGNTYFPGAGISNPFMPADPQVGDRISAIFPESTGTYSEVTETGVDVSLNTGLGPFSNCVEVTSFWDNTVEDLAYFCPGIGEVKLVEAPGSSGIELSEFGNNNSGPEPEPPPTPGPEPEPPPTPGPEPEPGPSESKSSGGGGGCFVYGLMIAQ